MVLGPLPFFSDGHGRMYFAYFDESGDDGMVDSPTPAFTLSGLLVHERDWLEALIQLVRFRGYLKQQFGILPRVELKANWILQRKGDFKALALSFAQRLQVMEAAMRFQRKCGRFRVFAVVVHKDGITQRGADPRDLAWLRALEVLQEFADDRGEHVHVFPDEGHGHFIRHRLREMRRNHVIRALATGEVSPLRILEDPSERRSEDSYFIQLADLNAFAAYKHEYPGPAINTALWEALGTARMPEVNRAAGETPGILPWPR